MDLTYRFSIEEFEKGIVGASEAWLKWIKPHWRP